MWVKVRNLTHPKINILMEIIIIVQLRKKWTFLHSKNSKFPAVGICLKTFTRGKSRMSMPKQYAS